MIPGCFERILDAGKNTFSIVVYGRGFSMHEAIRPDNVASEDIANALVPQADAE